MKYIFIGTLGIVIILTMSLSQHVLALDATNRPTLINFASTSDCATSVSCSNAQQGANVVNNGSSLSIKKIIGTTISILGWIIGIVAVFMVIFGGFRFVTSGGDANAVSSARSTIFYALIGLVVAALSQVLAHYVLKSLFPKI